MVRRCSPFSWRIAVSTLLAWAACAAPAAAQTAVASGQDPLHRWALPEVEVAFVFRGADMVADVLDFIEPRFGPVPNVSRALGRLRAFEISDGIRPMARVWGKGLVPGRGIAIYVHGDRGRLVIGADDAEAARVTLTEWLRAADIEARVEGADIIVEDNALGCGLRGEFLVCDSESVPEEMPELPTWLSDARLNLNGIGWIHVRGEVVRRLADDQAIFEQVWMSAVYHDDRFEVAADLQLNPFAMGPMSMFVTADGPAAAMGVVDERTTAVAKVSFDAQRLFSGLEAMAGGQLPPPIAPAVDALETHWTGDIVLTLDGGWTHPVVGIGLQSPDGGQALVDTLVDLLRDEMTVVSGDAPTRPGLKTIAFSAEGHTFHLHYAVVGDALVLGLVPADVERRVRGQVVPAALPRDFAGKGVHGLLIRGWAGALALPWIAEVVTGGEEILVLSDLHVVMGAVGALVEEGAIIMRPGVEGQTIRMWWRIL